MVLTRPPSSPGSRDGAQPARDVLLRPARRCGRAAAGRRVRRFRPCRGDGGRLRDQERRQRDVVPRDDRHVTGDAVAVAVLGPGRPDGQDAVPGKQRRRSTLGPVRGAQRVRCRRRCTAAGWSRSSPRSDEAILVLASEPGKRSNRSLGARSGSAMSPVPGMPWASPYRKTVPVGLATGGSRSARFVGTWPPSKVFFPTPSTMGCTHRSVRSNSSRWRSPMVCSSTGWSSDTSDLGARANSSLASIAGCLSSSSRS